MFYCEECRVKNDYPKGMVRSMGPCEICREVTECNDVSSRDITAYKERFATKICLQSTSFFHAPGMCLAYQRARQMNDKQFVKMFENGLHEDVPKEVLDLIAEGKFEIKEADVMVLVPKQQGEKDVETASVH